MAGPSRTPISTTEAPQPVQTGDLFAQRCRIIINELNPEINTQGGQLPKRQRDELLAKLSDIEEEILNRILLDLELGMAQARRILEPEFEGPNFIQPSSMIVNRYKSLARLCHPEVARYWGYHVDEGFSISLDHFSKLGRDMDSLEGTLCSRIQVDLENLQKLMQIKLLVCTKCSTKDNYWSDIKDSV
ncbi:hypothetical protein EJ110_NYTH23186 [Nymphaea thermarum]|nr:hypothetical protein EJ110_NYTH23186 [Nymphaea thermarum]